MDSIDHPNCFTEKFKKNSFLACLLHVLALSFYILSVPFLTNLLRNPFEESRGTSVSNQTEKQPVSYNVSCNWPYGCNFQKENSDQFDLNIFSIFFLFPAVLFQDAVVLGAANEPMPLDCMSPNPASLSPQPFPFCTLERTVRQCSFS